MKNSKPGMTIVVPGFFCIDHRCKILYNSTLKDIKMKRFISRKKVLMWLGVVILITSCVVPAFAGNKSVHKQATGCPAVILTNEEFMPALIHSIDAAQREIMMSIFSFKAGHHTNSYPDQIANHLAQAVKRGVNVFVILERTDEPSDDLDIQNRKTGKLLAEKGIKVYFDSPKKTTHTKLIVVDQKQIFLGSHNFTQSALKYNNEISVLLERSDLARDARNYMLKIIEAGK